MDWLERNLEAYRLVADILTDLRARLRRDLEEIHGDTWFRVGLPDGLLDRLIAVKEEEKSIDWYESEYQQVIDYAVFPDLLAIIEQNAGHFPYLRSLAPSAALLHARFLELEVIRNKLGRTRPVSDGEIAFLKTFHTRFRRAVGDVPAKAAGATAATTPPADATPSEPEPRPEAPVETSSPSAPGSEPGPEPQPEPEPDHPPEEAPPTRPARPPQRLAKTPDGRDAPPATPEEPPREPDDAGGADDGAPSPRRPSLSSALESSDSRAVLRELYREVTSIADGIWSSSAPPSTPIWDAVSESSWYELNFSKLQLRPLSDFYEVISKVEKKMDEGAKRDELQRFLKDSNFAQVLLALRDMFQKAGI